MKKAKKVLLCVSLITLSLALVLAPFTGAIEGDVTAGITTDGVWDITSDDILSDDSLFASLGDRPTTWTVHPTDKRADFPTADFSTIQSAIDNSNYGDSIEVWNGTYNEAVVLNKQLTLYSRDGANVTIVDAGGFRSAITIIADSCTVDGFLATRSGSNTGDAGIKVESNGNNIRNNFCCANKHNGIRLWNSSNNKILNNTCYENDHAGIYLEDSSNNIISYNEIYENSLNGLYISQSSDNVVSNNEIYKNKRAGVHVVFSSKNRIYGNDFVNNSMNVNSHDSDSIWNSMRVYTYNGSQYARYIGNYFSDYDDADNNRDGIGDEPHYFGSASGPTWTTEPALENDSYPLIQPFKYYILDNVLPIIQITSHSSLQDRPSIVYANGNYYVAYQSHEKGRGIFINRK
jgi:parallel beta-helix repeat protein